MAVKMSAAQRKRVRAGRMLLAGKRVGTLIKRQFGIEYSEVLVWRFLDGLGFSSQKPARRAIERDDHAVQTWKSRPGRPLKKPPTSEESSSSSTSRD